MVTAIHGEYCRNEAEQLAPVDPRSLLDARAHFGPLSSAVGQRLESATDFEELGSGSHWSVA